MNVARSMIVGENILSSHCKIRNQRKLEKSGELSNIMERRVSKLEDYAEKTADRLSSLETNVAVIKATMATSDELSKATIATNDEIQKAKFESIKWLGALIAMVGCLNAFITWTSKAPLPQQYQQVDSLPLQAPHTVATVKK